MYRRIIVAAAVVLILIPLGVFAQEGGVKLAPDAPKGIAYFDRLIGVWDFTTTSGGASFTGVWEFRYILGGNAIYNEWSFIPPNGRVTYGANIFINDPATDTWKSKRITTNSYTWRDYSKFDVNEEMIVAHMEYQRGGGTVHWRGTFHDITADSFKATYEISSDDGKTWIISSTTVAKRRE